MFITDRGLPEKVVQHTMHTPPCHARLWLMPPPLPPNFATWVPKWVPVLWKIGDKPMGVEYVGRRTVPGGEAADRSTKWKKVIPVLVFE